MRFTFIAAGLLLLLLLQGCASISQEDKDFYYSGWLHPKTDPEDQAFYRDFFTRR